MPAAKEIIADRIAKRALNTHRAPSSFVVQKSGRRQQHRVCNIEQFFVTTLGTILRSAEWICSALLTRLRARKFACSQAFLLVHCFLDY
jgi:hypothetical protein